MGFWPTSHNSGARKILGCEGLQRALQAQGTASPVPTAAEALTSHPLQPGGVLRSTGAEALPQQWARCPLSAPRLQQVPQGQTEGAHLAAATHGCWSTLPSPTSTPSDGTGSDTCKKVFNGILLAKYPPLATHTGAITFAGFVFWF